MGVWSRLSPWGHHHGVRGNYDVNGLVEEMLEKLIGMRDKILHRIKNIRKNDIQICKEQGINQEKMLSQLRLDVMNLLQNMTAKHELTSEHIKEITNDLLTIREIVIGEKMRLLMLPENKTIFLITNDECSICSKLRKIKDSVKSLLSCSQNKHLADKDDDDVRKTRECIDPLDYKTTLLKIILSFVRIRLCLHSLSLFPLLILSDGESASVLLNALLERLIAKGIHIQLVGEHHSAQDLCILLLIRFPKEAHQLHGHIFGQHTHSLRLRPLRIAPELVRPLLHHLAKALLNAVGNVPRIDINEALQLHELLTHIQLGLLLSLCALRIH